MSDVQARLETINAKLQAELINRTRLKDATGNAIVLIWIGAAVFFGFMLAEPQFKLDDLVNQEQTHVVSR